MVRHVVLFRWVEGTDDTTVADIGRRLGELPGRIDTIRRYRFGADLGINDGNADFAVVADFDDEAGYLAYRDHPDHQAVIRDHIAPVVAERTAVQFPVSD